MSSENSEVLWKDRKHFMWFPWSFTRYYIQDDRLMVETGLLQTSLEETLLYRIVDITMKQSLAGRIFNTGDVIIHARVDNTPEIVLKNIVGPKQVRSLISNLVEDSRSKRNVVGKEFYGGPGPMPPHLDEDGDGFCDLDDQHMPPEV